MSAFYAIVLSTYRVTRFTIVLKTKDLTSIAIGAALIAVCSWISIPTTVPFTLQTLAVFFIIGLLGGKKGTLAVLVYIAIGAMGLRVFSGFNGGLGYLFGSTGGYIFGFLGTALVIWAITHVLGEKPLVLVISMLIGLLVCYLFGTAWFMMVYFNNAKPVSWMTALSRCVFPFILPDLLKLWVAFLLSKRLKPFVNRYI